MVSSPVPDSNGRSNYQTLVKDGCWSSKNIQMCIQKFDSLQWEKLSVHKCRTSFFRKLVLHHHTIKCRGILRISIWIKSTYYSDDFITTRYNKSKCLVQHIWLNNLCHWYLNLLINHPADEENLAKCVWFTLTLCPAPVRQSFWIILMILVNSEGCPSNFSPDVGLFKKVPQGNCFLVHLFPPLIRTRPN